MSINPLLRETVHAMHRAGRAQMDFLFYLFLLAAAVFIWWPKHSLSESLQRETAPDTLLVALLVCGAIIAWWSARAGAEEFLLDDQHGLRDWAVATPLGIARILRGYVYGHFAQCAHLLALSMPIVLLAFHIGGGQWPAIVWSLLMACVQALFFRLSAAAFYIAAGRHRALTAIGVRLWPVLVYASSALLWPVASHLVITARTLDGGSSPLTPGIESPPMAFIALYGLLSVALLAIVHRQLSRLREQPRAAKEPVTP